MSYPLEICNHVERADGKSTIAEHSPLASDPTGSGQASPRDNVVYGTGEIEIESADRAAGYFTTRSDGHPKVNARTSGVYLRADPKDMSIMDGRDDRERVELIAEQLSQWKSITHV